MNAWTCPKCKRSYPYTPAKCHYCLADARSAKRAAWLTARRTAQLAADPFAGIPNAHDEDNRRF